MNRATIAYRSVFFYRRTLLAAGAGVMIACAVIAGALIVGDSMRFSLREHALRHLGRVTHQVSGQRSFREEIVREIDASFTAGSLVARGAAVHAESRTRAENVTVFGVDPNFARLEANRAQFEAAIEQLGDREVILNQTLADQIGATSGDSLLLRIGAIKDIPDETLLGRRDTATESTRVRVAAIVPDQGIASYSPVPQHNAPRNAFLKLAYLQEVLKQEGRINTILLAAAHSQKEADTREQSQPDDNTQVGAIEEQIRGHLSASDLGLNLRIDLTRGYVGIESTSMLVPDALETLLKTATGTVKGRVLSIFTHLANSIERANVSGATDEARPAVPYSTVTAVPEGWLNAAGFDGTLGEDDILLNRWTADALGISSNQTGETIRLRYYLSGDFGEIVETSHDFHLAGIVDIDGYFADQKLTPEYPGITDTKRISDWDPPFPVDLKRVQDADDAYWETYRATPKAFIAASAGDHLWAESTRRFGSHTSLMVYPPRDVSVFTFYQWLLDAVLEQATLEDAGIRVTPVRSLAINSGKGSTDFGGLFVGFSFFLIFAAIFLVTLLLKLSIAQRVRQVGLMLAVGFAPRTVSRLLLLESLLIGCLGALAGLPFARLYAGAMIAGLQSWWSDAVNAPFLEVYATPLSYVIGAIVAVLVAVGSAAIALRQIRRIPPNTLLTGAYRTERVAGHSRYALPVMILSLTGAAGAIVAGTVTDFLPPALAFFFCGAGLLTGALSGLRWRWQPAGSFADTKPGFASAMPLARRQAARYPDRSLLTIGLLATATFLITALQAFRIDADFDTSDRQSGTGGFAIYAESAVPILFDLTSDDGAERLALGNDMRNALADAEIAAFRLRPGDETGCQNLYLPTRPRILGATERFRERGGFRFSGSLADAADERDNPWLLLDEALPDGTIPAIGDEASVMWQLHSGLGKSLTIEDETGRDRTITFVALLSGSVLQNEIVVAEDQFKQLFPSTSGYAFFLISPGGNSANQVGGDLPASALSQLLERDLGDFGFDAGDVSDRLAGFFSVQNTYLSTFQSLGGLGLVLGTFGLTAVLLRNIWERRREYALLQAIGFSNRYLQWVTLFETAWLVLFGVAAGLFPALLAVTPQLIKRGMGFPWLSLFGIMLGVLLVGILPAWIAVRQVFRQSLIGNLRRE